MWVFAAAGFFDVAGTKVVAVAHTHIGYLICKGDEIHQRKM